MTGCPVVLDEEIDHVHECACDFEHVIHECDCGVTW